ncbi:multicopper oxidase family protein [Pseudooceanicola sp.]|uniref:multicopper oxidase family protein n=1 Tax=Pseudooceanicola sp. TaxID=1914328 RepID=UPI004058650C
MARFAISRRGFCASLAAGAAFGPRPLRAAEMPDLMAGPTSVQIAPEGYGKTNVWSYGGTIPGTPLHARQGERLRRRLVNELPVATSVHWHGIRIDNAMDGVAGLTQDPVAPGETFDYDFVLPDAGTYWYHAHTNSMEQVARGLSGPLIIAEAASDAPDVDRDEVLMLDDWLLNPEDGQIVDNFDNAMTLSHGGRMGNLIGTNAQYDYTLPVKTNERLRLRLINAANARIFGLRLEGVTGWTIALDGMPLEEPEPLTGPIILAPAQRIDLIIDVTADEGDTAGILRRDDEDTWRPQAIFPVRGRASKSKRAAPSALPPNPRMDMPNLADARPLDMPMEGGAMGRMRGGRMGGGMMGFRDLMQAGQFWSLAGQIGLDETPFARLSRGEPARMTITNDTVFPHAMHLHGMHFRTIATDGTPGPMRDTVLVLPNEKIEIAFTADNPGKWLFHCHMLGHAASGMTTWIDVT